MVLFESKRLSYRALQSPQDDQFWHQLMSEPSVWENSIDSLHQPVNTTVTGYVRKEMFETSILGVVICKKETSPLEDGGNETNGVDNPAAAATPIGVLGLNAGNPLQFHNRAARLGIMLRSEFQGQGYGPESVEWALEWAFLSAGLHRVSLSVLQWNHHGIRAYEKVGFVLEGRRREAAWKDGKWWDQLDMSVLQAEWAEKHGKEIAA